MLLTRHFTLLHNIIDSRRDTEIERFQITEIVANREGIVEGRLRFWDNSLFEFVEALRQEKLLLVKVQYAYHYQANNGRLYFRYNNAPHHPHISTFPHHKHTWDEQEQREWVNPSNMPQFSEVLAEIDSILYP